MVSKPPDLRGYIPRSKTNSFWKCLDNSSLAMMIFILNVSRPCVFFFFFTKTAVFSPSTIKWYLTLKDLCMLSNVNLHRLTRWSRKLLL